MELLCFSLGIFIAILVLNTLIGRGLPVMDPKKMLVFITTVVLVGVFGEVFVDSLYDMAFGRPLWHYQILPVHNTYTSKFAVVLWALYGMHIFWFHNTLSKWGVHRRTHLALILSLEAIILESLVNLASLMVFGKLVYFYTPNDLWHVTTIQNIPCYFGAGWVILGTLKRFEKDPKFFTKMSILIVFVFIFLA